MKPNPYIFTVIFALLLLSALAGLSTLSQSQILTKFDITIVGTNDIHGSAYPILLSRKDTGQKYSYGGLVYMARLIEIIKQQNHRNILYLDAGDQFQGALQASKIISSGQIISDYFNHINMNGGAVGNHEFDFGPQFLDNYINKLNHNVLDSNLIDTSKQQLPLPKQQRSKLYTFPIKERSPFIDPQLTQIKIGVIGLSTIQTPYTTSGFIQHMFPSTYVFEQYKSIVIQQATKLKSQGAHAIVIVSHVGNQCNKNSDYGLWTIKNQPTIIPCSKDDQMFQLIDQLPNGLIDAVVQGHRHTQSHYFYKGIPIIGTVNGGFYLNTIRLRFTLNKKQVYILDQDLLIQGPIPVCQRIFHGTNKCQYIPPQGLQKAGQLRQWSFHGQKVYADPQLTSINQQKYSQKMKIYQYQIVNNYIPFPIVKNYTANSYIGDLITNVMANSIKKQNNLNFDFLILNSGGFRTTWYPGVIRYAQLHSMFPFDNQVYSFKISGNNLKTMIEIIQNGAKKYYATWGLQQKFIKTSLKQHQNHYHNLISLWSKQQSQYLDLQSLVSTLTKQPIQDDKIYTGVTIGFLLNGGDDFSQVVNRSDQIKIFDKVLYPIMFKDLLQIQLQEMGQLQEDDIIGPNKMERIILEQKWIRMKQIR